MMLPELQDNRRSKAQVMADRAAMAEFMRKKNAMAGARKADAAELKNLKAKMFKGEPHSLAYMTEQEMKAMNELKNEPGLRGRLARKGAKKKFIMRDGIPSFEEGDEDYGGEMGSSDLSGGGFGGGDSSVDSQQSGNDNFGHDFGDSDSGGGNPFTPQRDNNPFIPQKTPEQIEAERRAKAKKEWDAKNKADDEKFKEAQAVRDRERYTKGQMVDAEGRTMSDRGEFVDAEGRKQGEEGFDFETAKRQGGFDESTAKLDTEGSFEGYRQDYKGLRDDADFSGYRDDMGGYQDAADQLRGEAATKYGGYESQISKMPDYSSQVGAMAGQMASAGGRMEGMGTAAQQQLAGLNPQIANQTAAGQKGISDASAQVGSAMGDVKGYESNVGKFAQQGANALSGAANKMAGYEQGMAGDVSRGQAGIAGAVGQGRSAAQQGQSGIAGAVGQGGAAAQRGEGSATAAQQNMAGARGRLGAMEGQFGELAGKAQDTAGLMKDRGLFAGQLETARKTAEEGNLANIRRSMAASGASPQEIARAEAEARKGGSRAGREDALRASQMAMQSGQSQLGQAAGFMGQAGNLASQQAGIAANEGQMGMAGAGMGMDAARMGMQGAQAQYGMGMDAARMGMQGAQAGAQLGLQGRGQMAGLAAQQGQMGAQGAQMGMQGAQTQASMAGQRAAMAGQQAGMAQNSANLGLAGLGQQAGNIQAGAGLGMQGVQGNLGAMGAATGALGQAQNLGLGKIGAQAGMYGQGLQAQTNLMGMGANLAGQQQSSLQSELATKGAFTDQMAGMTEAQLQDVVAQQNQAFEKEMAEKGYGLQRAAAQANRPRSPSAFDQMMGLAQTVAPFAIAAWSDKNLKKNIRSAKDKDLLNPGQIDGFLDSLFAKQYNYKSKTHGEGKQVGIMAQDLEKTQLGKQMVENTPEGKRVNFGKGLGLVMASQARLNERLNALGA